jgi:hypothetical protein
MTNISLLMKTLKWKCGSGRDISQNLYAAEIEALVKRWVKDINVDGGYFQK